MAVFNKSMGVAKLVVLSFNLSLSKVATLRFVTGHLGVNAFAKVDNVTNSISSFIASEAMMKNV